MSKTFLLLFVALLIAVSCQTAPTPMPVPTLVPPTITPTSVPPTLAPTPVPPTTMPTSVAPTIAPTSVPPTATPTKPPATATSTTTPLGPVSELAPTGKLRISLYLQNANFITKNANTGELTGVWPELARELASRLNVPYVIVGSDDTAKVFSQLKTNDADIVFADTSRLPGIDDPRLDGLDFTPAYVQVPSTIMVSVNSSIRTLADLKRPGVRIAVVGGGTTDLFLGQNYKEAQVVRVTGSTLMDAIKAGQADAVAGPMSSELNYIGSNPDYRILSDPLYAMDLRIGLPTGHPAALAYLKAFVQDILTSGLVQRLIDQSGRKGIVVPSQAPVALTSPPPPTGPAAATPKEALQVLEKWTKAFTDSDVDGIVKLYAPDALFFGTTTKSVVTKPADVRAYFENALLNNRPRSAKIVDQSVMVVSDSVVVFTGVDTITGVTNGTPTSGNGRFTFVIAKRGSEWQIVHFHRSAMPN